MNFNLNKHIVILISILCLSTLIVFGKDRANKSQTTMLGEVTKVDSRKSEITIKTGNGDEYLVKSNAQTTFKQIPPGATSLENAKSISFSDVVVGDRLLAAGQIDKDSKSVLALQIVIVSNRDLTKVSEKVSEEWDKNDFIGEIVSIDLTKNSSIARIKENNQTKEINLLFTEASKVRRFANDSVAYKDTIDIKPADIKQKDLFRALLLKKDESNYEIREILIGTFKLLSGTITNIDKVNRTLKINELVSGQAMTVVFDKTTFSRSLTDDLANKISDIYVKEKSSEQIDLSQKIKQMPEVEFDKLEVGDMILLNSIAEEKAQNVTALTLISGVEPILKPIAKNIKASKNKSNFKLGLPEGLNSLVLGF